VILFRKQGKPPGPPSPEAKEASRLTKEQRSAWFRGVWDDIFPTRQEAHQAMFPVELPRRLIRMYSFAGETVLDPFLGSGTTALAAAETGRNSVGYEINPEFEATIRSRFDPPPSGSEITVKHRASLQRR
jgi:DNA modification methylase